MVDLINDISLKNEQASNFSGWYGPIDERNADDGNSAQRISTNNIPVIVNYDVNDINSVMIDGKTYIAVATDGGVSLINETDGTIVNITPNMNSVYNGVRGTEKTWLTSKGEIYYITRQGVDTYWDFSYLAEIPTTDISGSYTSDVP